MSPPETVKLIIENFFAVPVLFGFIVVVVVFWRIIIRLVLAIENISKK